MLHSSLRLVKRLGTSGILYFAMQNLQNLFPRVVFSQSQPADNGDQHRPSLVHSTVLYLRKIKIPSNRQLIAKLHCFFRICIHHQEAENKHFDTSSSVCSNPIFNKWNNFTGNLKLNNNTEIRTISMKGASQTFWKEFQVLKKVRNFCAGSGRIRSRKEKTWKWKWPEM